MKKTIIAVLALAGLTALIGLPMMSKTAIAQDRNDEGTAPNNSADTAPTTSTTPTPRQPDHLLPNLDNNITRGRTEVQEPQPRPVEGPTDTHVVNEDNVNSRGIRIDPDTHRVDEVNTGTAAVTTASPTSRPTDNHATRRTDPPTDTHLVDEQNVNERGIVISPSDRHLVDETNVDEGGRLIADGRTQPKPQPRPADNHNTRGRQEVTPAPSAPASPEPSGGWQLPGNASSGPLYETVHYPDGTRVYVPRVTSQGRLPDNPERSGIRLGGNK